MADTPVMFLGGGTGVAAELIQVNGTNPNAGAEVAETVPAGQTWQLLAISVLMVQGLTQTPQPILQLDDGTDVVFESLGCSAAQAASTTCRYTWGVSLALSGQIGTTPNIHAFAPLPQGLFLGPGYRILTSTLGIGANSNYGAPSLFYVRYE